MYTSTSGLLVASTVACLCILASAERKSKSCCWPDTFESLLAVEGGIIAENFPGTFQAEIKLFFDKPNQRWGIIDGRYHINGAYEGHFIGLDYATGKQHQAQYECYEKDIGDSHPFRLVHPCIPDHATLLGTYKMGYGDQSLEYDMWQWSEIQECLYDGKPSDTVVRASVTSDCHWLSETALWKKDNDKFNYTVNMGFFDQRLQLGPDNVFDELKTIGCEAGLRAGEAYFDPFRSKHMMYIGRRLRERKPGMETVEEVPMSPRSRAPTIVPNDDDDDIPDMITV